MPCLLLLRYLSSSLPHIFHRVVQQTMRGEASLYYEFTAEPVSKKPRKPVSISINQLFAALYIQYTVFLQSILVCSYHEEAAGCHRA